ncbi:MAG: DUF2125 domain-containing protein [Hyphomicrobiales bacterium]|nr:DUF2125 domain-containing protein [Hyphomicrobiales bacterium]
MDDNPRDPDVAADLDDDLDDGRRPRPGAGRRLLLRALAAGGLLVAVLGGYAGYWFWAAAAVRDGAADWVARAAADGLVARFEGMEVGGFPFYLVLRLEQPRLAAPRAPQPWAWGARRAVARARPWDLNHVHVDAAGDQGVTVTVDGRDVAYTGRAERLEADLTLRHGRMAAVAARVGGLGLDAPAPFGPVAVRDLAVDLVWPSDPGKAGAAAAPATSLHLDLRGRGLSVSDGLDLPLGAKLSAVALSADLRGPIPRPPDAASLAAWRDAGGTLEVVNLDLDYGPLSLLGEGTLAVDEALQPVGAMTAKIQGFFEAVDALRARGLIRSRAASTAKILLGVMAKKSPEGGPSTLSLPLTLQERKLYVGPVPLVVLPPLRWAGAPPPDTDGKADAGG